MSPSEHHEVFYDRHQVFAPLRGTFVQGRRSGGGFRMDSATVGDVSGAIRNFVGRYVDG